MYKTRKALIDHLKTADVPSPAATIDKYAGELGDKQRAPSLPRLTLPAILVLFLDGFPLREVQEHQFSLLVVTETRTATKEESEKDALKLIEDYAKWLIKEGENNYRFEDDTQYYQLVDLQNARANTLLNDHKYTIVELPVIVRSGV